MTDAANEPVDTAEGGRPDGATDEGEAGEDHLDGVADGCGCTEIWEHLSERREAERAESDD